MPILSVYVPSNVLKKSLRKNPSWENQLVEAVRYVDKHLPDEYITIKIIPCVPSTHKYDSIVAKMTLFKDPKRTIVVLDKTCNKIKEVLIGLFGNIHFVEVLTKRIDSEEEGFAKYSPFDKSLK